MSRVFVVQQPRENRNGWTPNLEPATKYGPIHFIYMADDRPTTDWMSAIFRAGEALADFNPDRDYILSVPNGGDPNAPLAVWSVISRNLRIRKVKVLNWQRSYRKGQRDPHNGFYTPSVLTLPQAQE